MTRSLLTPPTLLSSTKLPSSAPPSPLTRVALRNSTSSRCGEVPTEPSETSLTALSSESQSSFQTFLDSSQDGPSQSLSEDMLMVTNTSAKTTSLRSLERLSWFSPLMTEAIKPNKRSIISLEREPISACSTPKHRLSHSLGLACNTLSVEATHLSSLQRTPS